MPDYYSFRVAGWQILSLNSETEHGYRSPQVRWLARKLERPGTCRIAFAHQTALNAGDAKRQTTCSRSGKRFAGTRACSSPAMITTRSGSRIAA